ncbi:mannosyl transferase [Microbotryum lychnidis-dioicae p1A1 Lamole]|uniref:Mannosyl transferase n=1 Tax=Microbotryum lychnidis-dioicae (strain p1A1 Lamole / MvSl-1064) TaxID=683840 RepID=U5HGJ0_USTV1|nr:mannosyl transferase [Microbotryum lychnidis-dioicae p1A1 Lamole]|eukprot:KDE03326.1 mannosyl transferase [Microbotryum lychnidis-dioicae p1A1 Lamole]
MIDKLPVTTHDTPQVALALSALGTAPSRPSRYLRFRHLLPSILIAFTIYHLLPLAAHHLKRVYDDPRTAQRWQTLSSAKGTPVATSMDELGRQHQTLLDRQHRSINLVDSIGPEIEMYADQVKVVHDLDRFTRTPTSPHLPQDEVDKITNSAIDLRDSLFTKLFPYIASGRGGRRSFDQLIDTFTRPKGVVIPCSNWYFRYALHLITTLKKVHLTTLPILIVHAGPDDLSPKNRQTLKSLSPDVDVLDLLHFFSEDHVGLLNGGWAIKPIALLASPFKETILVDADVVFMQDPNVLLQDPGYRETGTLFFRDRELFPTDDAVHIWFEGVMKNRVPSAMLNKSRWWKDRASREEMESGVVVVDKGRRDVVLGMVFVGWLNTKQIRDEVTYKRTFGDKESYWIAFELAGIPYYFDPPFASTIGHLTYFSGSDGVSAPQMCSEHHLHLDRKGRPFWWNGSLFEDKRNPSSTYFLATHYSSGTADWATESEPWCMRSLKETDVIMLKEVKTDLGVGFDEVYTRVLGAAVQIDLWAQRCGITGCGD